MSTNSIKWIAKGRKRSQSPDPVHLIEIEESDKRVKHKAGDPPFGTPIDTPLAIELIRNLWQAVNKDDLFTIRQQFKNLTNQLSSAQQDLDKEVVKKIEALAEIRNRLIHFGRFPERESVRDDAILFIRLTEFVIAKTLGLSPSNVFNTVENLEKYLEKIQQSGK